MCVGFAVKLENLPSLSFILCHAKFAGFSIQFSFSVFRNLTISCLIIVFQALMYPLLVACKSISNLRRAAAQEVVDKVRQHSGLLVDQVKMVTRMIIFLWHLLCWSDYFDFL